MYTVKPIVAHSVKADGLSLVRWKDIPDVYFTDGVSLILAAYRCIEEDNFDCKLPALPPSLLIGFVANNCNCRIISSVSR